MQQPVLADELGLWGLNELGGGLVGEGEVETRDRLGLRR
jgi:hypothetical protein